VLAAGVRGDVPPVLQEPPGHPGRSAVDARTARAVRGRRARDPERPRAARRQRPGEHVMAEPMKALRGGHGALAGSFLLVLGCLSVLGTAFMLGVVAAHVWPGFPIGLTSSALPAKTGKERSERSARAPESTPTLTFYQELTAPLTAPPLPKPLKPARVERAAEPAKTVAAERSDALASANAPAPARRSEEHTSELQSLAYLVCRLLLEKKKKKTMRAYRRRKPGGDVLQLTTPPRA